MIPPERPAGVRPIGAPGHMGVDYEERVDFGRLRGYRIARARAALEASECGAFLLFDFYNIRYTTQTWIGGALGDKMIRYALLFRDRDPILWDFGSAVRHHKLYSKWLPDENWRPGFLGFRGAVAPEAGLMRDAVTEIKSLLNQAGVAGAPLGIDIVEPPFLFELQRQGIAVRDAQQAMLDARVIKSADEIMLLNQAAAMVDGVYQDIVDVLKPGMRENEIVALANKRLYELGSDQVEAVNSISGERCNPHPHNFTDRIIRPGDQAFFDIIHSFNGYRTCYYRTFGVGSATQSQHDAYTQAREWMDTAIAAIKPGVSTDAVARILPRAAGLRLRERARRLRPAVRARARARPARAADHLAAQLAGEPGRAAGGHGLRDGDLLPGLGRHLRGAHRGGGRRHRLRHRDPHEVPGPEAVRREQVLKSGHARRCRRAVQAAPGGLRPRTAGPSWPGGSDPVLLIPLRAVPRPPS